MTPARLNLISAVISVIGALLFAMAQNLSTFIWLAASIVWLTLAIYQRRNLSLVRLPKRHLIRRFTRLLLFS